MEIKKRSGKGVFESLHSFNNSAGVVWGLSGDSNVRRLGSGGGAKRHPNHGNQVFTQSAYDPIFIKCFLPI